MVEKLLVAAAFLVAAIISAFFFYGPRNSLALIGGDPDLGPVDFATLERRDSPNDALGCPPGHCPKARADFEPPVYELPAAALAQALADTLAQEERVEIVERTDDGLYLRAVQRTRIMQYPDTIDVEFIPIDGGERSTLAIYSRSKFGRSDFGVNRARIRRWLSRIGHLGEEAGRPA